MTIISKLKALVGLDNGDQRASGTSVTVEREPAAERERAVKEPVSDPAAATDSEPATEPDSEPATETGSEPAVAEAASDAGDPVDTISGIGSAYAERLAEAGVETVDDLASADPADLAGETGLGEARVTDWIERARNR